MSKIHKLLLIILIIWVTFFTTDYILYRFQKKPFFSIPIKAYKDGGTVEYYGIGYKIIKYNVFDDVVTGKSGKKDMEFGFWTLQYSKE